MGIRLLSLHHKSALQLFIRNSSASSSSPVVKKYEPASPEIAKEIEDCYGRLDLTFTNTKEAFKSKSNTEMVRALMVFQLCGINFLVQNNQHILNVMRRILGKNLFKKVIKSSFFGHFVAGETKAEVEPVVSRLKRFGVKSILDYSAESDLSAEEASTKTEKSNLQESVEPSAIKDNVEEKTVTGTHSRYSSHKEFADRRKDVVSARTYFYEGEHMCDKNRDIFMESIDAVAHATGGEGFAAIKITALGRPALLLKLSESIAQANNFFKALSGPMIQLNRLTEEDFVKRLKEFGVKADTKAVRDWFKTVDFDDDGHIDFHGWNKLLDDNSKLGEMFQVLNIKTGHLEPLITNLTSIEEQEVSLPSESDRIQFANMVRRTREITEYAIKKGIRIMIDAEQTYFQPAISRLSIEMMRKYNKDRGNVFNTYQAYLKDTLTAMECDMQLARREGWHFGAKLVRGAYMEQERKRAETVGYEDPVNPNYETTSLNYERCLTRIADEHDRRGKGNVSVMIASHNEDTVRFSVKLMKERCIAPSERIMCFAQLYGMCDQVSFSLGQAGYSVYKYLPYGPVEEVLPYLSRRALENGSVLAKAKKDKNLLWREFTRRLVAGQWTYSP